MGKSFYLIQKEIRKLQSQHTILESVPFGMLLAIVGGFLDSYTYIGRGGVFANAQTGNIVFLGIYASKGEWGQALVHIPPILAFILGVIVVEAIKNNNSRLLILDWARAVLILETLVLFIVGFIPQTIPNIVVNVTVAFVSSLQVSSFRKLVDSPFNTTMSTGNLRTASQAAYIAFKKKDPKAASRSIQFFLIIFSFILGAFLGGTLTLSVGIKSIWFAVIVLLFAVILSTYVEQKKHKEE
jgi:uncharacterized membrane protein YoaK (UPF0700 family)